MELLVFMNRKLLKDALGWGIGLWLFGYILGIIFFPFLPNAILGWVIMPFGTLAALWVLLKKVKGDSIKYYLTLSLVWTLIAIVFDYFFLVKAFNPADGYYKLDVYLYYAFTFLLPLLIGYQETKVQK